MMDGIFFMRGIFCGGCGGEWDALHEREHQRYRMRRVSPRWVRLHPERTLAGAATWSVAHVVA